MTSAFEGIDFQARTHALAWGRHNAPPKQKEYMRDLLAASDYPRLDIDQVAQLFKVRATSTRVEAWPQDWERHKIEGIMTYRDRSHRSVITGNLAPQVSARYAAIAAANACGSTTRSGWRRSMIHWRPSSTSRPPRRPPLHPKRQPPASERNQTCCIRNKQAVDSSSTRVR